MSRLNRPAFFAFSAIGGYLNDLRPGRWELLDHLPNRAHLGDRLPTLRTALHRRLNPTVDLVRLPTVGGLVSLLSPRPSRILGALLLTGPEGRRLALAFPLGLVALLAQPLGLAVQVPNLLLQFLDTSVELADLLGLSQNDLDQRVRILAQALECLPKTGVPVGVIS